MNLKKAKKTKQTAIYLEKLKNPDKTTNELAKEFDCSPSYVSRAFAHFEGKFSGEEYSKKLVELNNRIIAK